jgi:hypothetical protein
MQPISRNTALTVRFSKKKQRQEVKHVTNEAGTEEKDGVMERVVAERLGVSVEEVRASSR